MFVLYEDAKMFSFRGNDASKTADVSRITKVH